MRIGIIYSHLSEGGGIENVILNQVKILSNDGHNVNCYFAYVDKNLPHLSNLQSHIHSYYPNTLLPNNKTLRVILSIPMAPLTTKKLGNEELLICHGYSSAPWIGYMQKKLRKTKVISYIHFPPRMFYLNKNDIKLWCFDNVRKAAYALGRISRPILEKIDRMSILNSDIVLANSLFTQKRVKKIYGLSSTVCYPPVDTEVFRILPRSQRSYDPKFTRPIIFSSGRIIPVKRFEWLIESLYHVKKIYPSANLLIAGGIPSESRNYFHKLMKIAETLKVKESIKFLGFVNVKELVHLYNMADVYAYSPPKEDFGLGPVEAMACGTPAVVWNDGSGPCETVIDGVTGYRAEPYNIKDFSDKIVKALNMGKKQSELMRQHVINIFSMENHRKILKEALRKCDVL
ncbi:MAG: glycosyltransferase family 4 protein [Candidatus Bathyarchaeia archaeon]